MIVVGAEKVREVYELQIIMSLLETNLIQKLGIAVLLDRIQDGKQFSAYDDAKRTIIPTNQGKKVIVDKTRD